MQKKSLAKISIGGCIDEEWVIFVSYKVQSVEASLVYFLLFFQNISPFLIG